MDTGRGKGKKETLVIDLLTNEEHICNSRFEACEMTGIERKSLNTYMKKGNTYNKRYKFVDISKENE